MSKILNLHDWSKPVQIRIRNNKIEIKPCVEMGGLAKSYYIDNENDEPRFWIEKS